MQPPDDDFDDGEFDEGDAERLADELQEVAVDLSVPPDAVRLTALLVLEGYDDEEILAHFRQITVSMDGEQNPMDRVVAMIAGVRGVISD